jgi:hypothetical protein|nr:MAG TPA: PROTEIN/RNA Complex, archaeal, ribosomal, 50S, protein.0A [Caudoviricetes sp.]
MAEYIKRETLLERAEYDNNYRLIIPAEAIKTAPAADVAPVAHGHRVDDGGFYARCSQCDGVLPLCVNFCPNCGAKMDGGAE